MNGITISFLVVIFSAVIHGHYNGRIRTHMYPSQNIHRDPSCSCSCEDLGSFVALVRALEEREQDTVASTSNGSINNANDLIMNLVNALIQLSTQALSRNHCHCPNQSGHNGGSGYNHQNGGSVYSDGGRLDFLNPIKKDNVLDLDIAGQYTLGVGLGGNNGGASQGSNNYYRNANGRSANGGNDEGLINVDLLNTNKKSNEAEVALGKQKLALDGGSSPSQASNSMTGPSSNISNPGKIASNVDLPNSNKKVNNVADADLAGKSVIGLENKNQS